MRLQRTSWCLATPHAHRVSTIRAVYTSWHILTCFSILLAPFSSQELRLLCHLSCSWSLIALKLSTKPVSRLSRTSATLSSLAMVAQRSAMIANAMLSSTEAILGFALRGYCRRSSDSVWKWRGQLLREPKPDEDPSKIASKKRCSTGCKSHFYSR